MKNKVLAVLLCCLVLLSCICAFPISAEGEQNTVGKAQGFADGIVAFLMNEAGASDVQELIDGALTETAGVSAEWYILALGQSGEYDFSSYEQELLNYLGENEIYSASSRQKYALCLSAVGSTSGYISSVMSDSIGKQGIMSWIYGLHLLNNGYVSDGYTADQVVEKLLFLRCEDGGWSLTGQSGDIDVTAMAIQALSVYYDTDASVKAAVDGALTFLSDRQLEDGDYSSYGVCNPESTSQVLVALSSLGVDHATDTRFIKNGNTLIDGIEKYRLADGSFCHNEGGASNVNATAQVLYATVSYIRMINNKPSLYIFDRGDPENVEPAPVIPSEVAQTANADTDGESALENGTGNATEEKASGSCKTWVCAVIVGIGGAVCLVLFLAKKRNIKNFIAVAVAVVIAVVFVCVTDFRTAEDYYGGDTVKENTIGTVTLTIRCDAVAGKSEYIPKSGIILDFTEFEIEDGDTVYSILAEAARKYRIQLENNGSSEMAYISGINHLYEYDFGDLSGWVYKVNGESPSVGCGEYPLSDGDVIEWHYTLELGNDVN